MDDMLAIMPADARQHDDPRVRGAAPGDGAAIARIQVATWREAYRDIVPADLLASLDEAPRAISWEGMLAEDASLTFLALSDSGPVGFVKACDARDPGLDGFGEIAALYVLRESWRSGDGRRLMDAARRALSARGCSGCVLWVFEANPGARAFYEALGFRDDGARKVHQRSGATEIRMQSR